MFVNKLKMNSIAEAVKQVNETDNLSAIAKKHGMEFNRTTYGAGMKHPKHGEISINRYGEWHHKGTKVTGNSTGNFSSLDKHLSSLKEELSPKQKKIAKLDDPKDKIDAGDLAKLRGEETELDEADKVATSTGMKVYGSSYGDSAKARRDQLKRPVDDTKGPKPSELAQMAKVKKEEFFKDKLINNYLEEDARFEEELNEVLSKDASAGEWISDFIHSDNPKFEGKSKKQRQKMALAAYYAKQRNESVDDSYPVTTDTVAGRMPGGMANTFKQFKVRVSAKDKEAAETKNRIPNSDPMNMSAREPHIGHGGLVSIPPQGVVHKEEVELDEDDASNIKKDIAASRLELKMKNRDIADKSYLKDRPGSVKSDIKNFGRFLAGKKETNEEVELDEADTIYVQHSNGAPQKVKLTPDMKAAGKIYVQHPSGPQTKVKLPKVKEETDLEEAVSRKDFQMVADLIKTHDNHDKRKELATHHAEIFHRQNPRFDRAKFMKAANVNEGKQPETDNVPFEKPYNTTSDPVTTDKSGAKHTPMSRARDLAQSAMKRVKSEMLGKAPGNNG